MPAVKRRIFNVVAATCGGMLAVAGCASHAPPTSEAVKPTTVTEKQFAANEFVLTVRGDGSANVRFVEGKAYDLFTTEELLWQKALVDINAHEDQKKATTVIAVPALAVVASLSKLPRAICAQLLWEREQGKQDLRPAAASWIATREIKLKSMAPDAGGYVTIHLSDADCQQITSAMHGSSSTAPTTEAEE